MPGTDRLSRPASLRELFADGGGVIGNPETLRCPHCGAEPRPYEVKTPRRATSQRRRWRS